MFKTLANAWKVEDLRKKLLVTLFVILLYRIGTAIVVPFVNANEVAEYVATQSNGIFCLLNTLSGSGLANASLFALGVSPYITASIVIQLLTVAIPSLERLAKQGEEGKQKITVITRYITVGISLITAFGYYMFISSDAVNAVVFDDWYVAVVMIACYCAGASLVMWLGEKINEHGIGNGISIILFANIVSRFIVIVQDYISKIQTIATSGDWTYSVPSAIVLLFTTIGMLALIYFVIFFSDSERRIPVQYAKKVVGRKMYGGRNTNLPIKLNMAGVMPVIFANAILSLPGMIFSFITTEYDSYAQYKSLYDALGIPEPEYENFSSSLDSFFSNTTSWFFILMTFILILAFAYFYISISFNPTEVAGNLQQNGGSIPGIRPGKPTATFIKKVLSKVTFMGALALSVVAIVPTIVYLFLNLLGDWTGLYGLMGTYSMIGEFVNSGTSVIIVVGVVLETIRDLEAQMTMRHYKGFLD